MQQCMTFCVNQAVRTARRLYPQSDLAVHLTLIRSEASQTARSSAAAVRSATSRGAPENFLG
jgi:hypothetical protein